MNSIAIDSKRRKFVAVGFLYNPSTQSVFLHHRDSKAPTNPNKWGFFGGAGQAGETPQDTLIRELREELNIQITSIVINPLCEYFVPETGYYRYVFFVESRIGKSAMRLGEGQGFDWVPINNLAAYDIHERAKEDLFTFLLTLESV